MDGVALTWAEVDRIVDQEVRRFRGTLPGYDVDDLRQECRMAIAVRADLARTGARTYARGVAQSRLTNLLRRSTTFGRCPHDAWGRPRPSLALSLDDVTPTAEDDVEALLEHRRAVEHLREHLDPDDWQQLVATFVEGSHAMRSSTARLHLAVVRHEATAILHRIGYRVSGEAEVKTMSAISIPEPPPDDTPSCHPSGTSPVGYDARDSECHNCRDKFTCLPRAIEQKLIALKLADDREVEAVLDGRLEFMDAIARMKRRLARKKAGEDLDETETTTWEGLAPGGAGTNAPEGEEEVEETEEAVAEEEQAAEEEEVDPPTARTQSERIDRGEEDVDATPAPSPTPQEGPVKNGKKGGAKAAKKTTAPKTPKKRKGKPEEQPQAAPAPEQTAPEPQTLTLRAVAKDAKSAELFAGEKLVARIEKTADGWGWFAANGKAESMDWFASYAKAVDDFLLLVQPEAEAKGLKLVLDESTRKLPKPAKAEAAPKAKKGAKSNGAAAPEPERVERPKSWPTMANGKPLPAPKQLTEEEMQAALEETQAKLGANIRLEYGMRIARRKRDGDIVTRITPHGFEYDVDEKLAKAAGFGATRQTFGSLSSVAMWAERRMVSGNDFFNLSKHTCTEVRDPKGRIIDRKGGVPLED